MTNRLRPTAGLKKKKYAQLLARGQSIYAALLANIAQFPNCNPTTTVLLTLLTAFQVAQGAVAGGGKLATQARNAKALLLVSALESEVSYVRSLCDASPEQAQELIAAAAMLVSAVGSHAKPILAVQLVPGSPGVVRAIANAKLLTGGSKKRPTFHWQVSINNGTTWTDGGSTPRGNTSIPNLPTLTEVAVRVCVTLGTVTGPWSQDVSILVRPV